jgi:hypothetical protein|tara:strand:+ start:450 stop:779 length:330 start_codon:yes stop_codon:yes gene_type:complete
MDRESISIQKRVYKKEDIDTVIDTEFKTFTKNVEVDTDTVRELFRLYDKLYYTIPVEGEDESHQYLLQRSSELTTLDKSIEDIQPLLDEVAQLRQQLLSANQQIFELEK